MTNEELKNQILELRLKDLTPDAFDLLFNFAFAKVVTSAFANAEAILTKKSAPKKEKVSKKIIQKKPAKTVVTKKVTKSYKQALDEFRNGEKRLGPEPESALRSKPPTKNARALKLLGENPTGLKAGELAEKLEDEVRLIYPLLSNLKREGKVVAKDGTYFAVRSNGE